MKVSYYELLGMIKDGNIPERIKACLVGNKEVVYIAEFETEDRLLGYMIENENEQDENYHYYLSECLIEYSMFDECIEIIEEEKEIEKLDIEENAMNRNERYIRKEDNKFVNLSVADYELACKINELIDEIKVLSF